MKRLVIARHGEYSGGGNNPLLNADGQAQMRRLADGLKALINGGSVVVLASTAARGSMSGKVVATCLECAMEECPVLWSDNQHDTNCAEVLELIQSKKDFDTVVLVTHLEYTQKLPSHIGEHLFGGKEFPFAQVPKGRAWVIDCVAQTCERL